MGPTVVLLAKLQRDFICKSRDDHDLFKSHTFPMYVERQALILRSFLYTKLETYLCMVYTLYIYECHSQFWLPTSR